MAERLPQGAFKHGRSQSLARLDISNGLQSSAALGSAGSEGLLGAHSQPFSPKTATTSIRDEEAANGITGPQLASNPFSGFEGQLLGSSQSASSPHAAGMEDDLENTLGRSGGSLRLATRLVEGDTNGYDTAQRNEEGSRTSGTSVSTENGREPETEWVEQDEPGVYITLTALPGGGKDLKRVRFRCAHMLSILHELVMNSIHIMHSLCRFHELVVSPPVVSPKFNSA